MFRCIILDLEATCWERTPPFPHETIEFGAVCWSSEAGIESEFQTFVTPLLCSTLSDFCIQLTGIQQGDLEGAPPFPQALHGFLHWVASQDTPPVASWGAYDYRQLTEDAARHQVPYPLPPHLNLKVAYSTLTTRKPTGMAGALRQLGLQLHGSHHRGLDDARNISRICQWMVAQGFTHTVD